LSVIIEKFNFFVVVDDVDDVNDDYGEEKLFFILFCLYLFAE
jgi:hypothetical protein